MMGYFSMCNEKEKSVEGQLMSALENISMWEEMDEGGEYLISGFVKSQIEEALQALNKGSLFKQENNGWEK
jgi:hypothetical protein